MRRSSGTSDTPARAIVIMSRPTSSTPSRVTLPLRGRSQPTIDLSVVVLPTPLRPSSATVSPAPISSDTSRSTWLSP